MLILLNKWGQIN